MLPRRSHILMNEAGADGGGGGAAAPSPSPAPAPGPAPSPAPAPGGDSILAKPPAASPAPAPGPAPAPAPAGTDELAWLPQKFRVNGADGKLDMAASSKKLGESYSQLERRQSVPAAATDYKFNPGDKFKDVKLDDQLSSQFREGALKAGFSQDQYQWVMEQYLEMVPQVLDATLQLSKQEATAELQKVWKSTAEFEAGVADAQRAVNGAPEAIRDDLWARFGRDPAFIQFAASLGKEMREDRSATTSQASGAAGTDTEVQALMASEAYRNPKHPEHMVVSQKVSAYYQRVHGNAPAM